MSETQSNFSLETLSEVVNYNRFVVDRMRPYLGKKVLELGAGIGNLTPLFLEDGRAVTAIDIEQSLVDEHRRRVPAASALKVECTSIQDLARRSGELKSYDTVVSSNVLEHIPDNIIGEVIAAMYSILKPGGHAVHWVPAFEGIFGTIDESFGHYRRYDRKKAARLFQDSGFQMVSCSYWNMIGFFGWWFNGRVLRKREIHRASALAFDKFLMPLVRVIEPAIWRPFGQSLLIVAKKTP
jgi:SAM-dependent methyltransferase